MRGIVLFLLALLGASPGFGLWRTLKTESFVLFYPAGRERQALEALSELEAVKGYAEALTGGRGRRLSVVLQDLGSYANAYADTFFRRISLYLYPPSEGELAFTRNWWRAAGAHELAHWLHLTAAAGVPGMLVRLFGDAYAPSHSVPDWLSEGLAVYAESGLSDREGRLNDGFYDAYLAVRVQGVRGGGAPSLSQASFLPPEFPERRAPRLFGGEFMEYLALTYGRESLAHFVQAYGSSLASYLSPVLPLAGLDRAARLVFGKRFALLWKEWQAWEAERAPRSASDQEASGRYWSLSPPVFWKGSLYFTCSYPVPAGPFRQIRRHELRALAPETGEERVVLRSSSPFSGPLRLRDSTLYYAVEDLEPGRANFEMSGFGYCSQLYAYDLESGRRRKLLRGQMRAFEVLEDESIVVSRDRTDTFGSEILLLRRNGLEPVLSTEFLVREIRSEGGRIFVSARRDGENFRVYRAQPDSEESFLLQPIHGEGFSSGMICLEGERVLFTANFGGRYAVYAYDPANGDLFRLTESGYADGATCEPESGRLYYRGLDPEGFALFRTELAPEALERVELEAFPVAEQARRPAPIGPVNAGGYGDNLRTLAPRWLFPVLAVDSVQESYLAGLGLMGVSALGDIRYTLAGLVDVGTGAPQLEAALELRLPPFTFSAYGSSIDNDFITLALEAPLLRRLGLVERSLSLELRSTWFDEGLQRFELAPAVGFTLEGALAGMEGSLGAAVERVELGSAENRLSLQGGLDARLSFRFGELEAKLDGFYVLQGRQGELEALRGYAFGLSGQAGVSGNLDFSIRLLKIRKGWWNPAVFLQDVYVVPFAAAALTELTEPQAAAGVELHWELKALAAGSGLPLDLFLRLAVNREAVVSVSFGLTAILPQE